MQPKLKELIIASFALEEHNPLYLKVVMLNTVMYITAVISFLFFLINAAIVKDYILAILDLMIFFAMGYALYLLRYKNNHTISGYIAVSTLFILHILIIYTQKGDHFTLIWSYFFVPFAMIILGSKRGLIISIPFLMIIFTISFIGIDRWDHGYWDNLSCFRFVLSHFAMLYVMYAIFHANEKAADKIEQLRNKDRNQLKRFERLSLTDPLTGLYNRRFLNEIFPKQFIDAKRDKKLLAFFLLDIDYFKPYNDTNGHQKGDDLLVKISDVLKKELNNGSAHAFRIGGDEFAGIIVANEKNDIRIRVKQIQHRISQLHISHRENPIKPFITVSIGVHIPTEKEYDFKEIYEITDRALYKAKAQGRDRIIFL